MPRPVVAGTATFAPVANTAGTSSPIVINTPSGATAGEWLIAALLCQTQTATDFTVPAGWTRIGLAAVNNADVRVTGLFAYQIVGTPPSSHSFTTPAGSARIGGVMFRVQNYGGVHATPAGYATRSGSTVTTGTIAVTANDCLRLEFGHCVVTVGNAGTVATPPASMTLVGSVISGLTAGSRDAGYVYAQDVDISTAPSKTFVFNGTLAAGSSNGIVLEGTPAGALTVSDLASGSTIDSVTLGVPVSLNMGRKAIVDAAPYRQWTVAQIDARVAVGHYVVMAHRGGGDRANGHAPEFSEYGYDLAVGAGRILLELSMARTSDGVWFGLHDENIDRVSGTAGNPDASAMTWAQVNAFTQTSVGGSGAQPFARFDTLMANPDYQHCVWMVDPKYGLYNGHSTEFLNMLDANGGPDRFIVKFFGVGSTETGFADAASARGYRTWGYFYEVDIGDGDVAAWQSHWDWLAMEYQASQGSWTTMLGYGKPVLVDPVATVANGVIGLDKGASGIQLGDPTGAVPNYWLASKPTIERVTLTVHVGIAVEDLTSSSSIDAVSLTQHNTLTVSDLASGSTIDSVTLTQHQALTVADMRSASSIDPVTLVQHHTITVQDLQSTSTVDSVALVQHSTIVVSDIRSATSIESITLAAAGSLVVSDLHTGTTIASVTLTQHGAVVVEDLTSGSSIDTVTLVQHHTINVEDLACSSSIDTIVWADPEIVITSIAGPVISGPTATLAIGGTTATRTMSGSTAILEITP